MHNNVACGAVTRGDMRTCSARSTQRAKNRKHAHVHPRTLSHSGHFASTGHHPERAGTKQACSQQERSVRPDGATGCSVAFETAWKANMVRQGTLRKTNHWQSFISITGVGRSAIRHMRNMKSVSFSDKRYWWIRQSLS